MKRSPSAEFISVYRNSEYMSNFSVSTFNLDGDDGDREHAVLMHVDLDMFFAAVEIRQNPQLRGKPLIVGNPDAHRTGKGVVLTASYEARKYGVHSGMPMNTALKLCPSAVISNSAREEYRPSSNRIMTIFKSLEVPMMQTSIDEAYIDISSLVSDSKQAYYLAKELQDLVFENEGITISIGVGPTLRVAKMASDYRKPNGITVVTMDGLEQFFTGLKITKIPGIGKVTGKKLIERGYGTCDTLFHLTEGEIALLLGENLGGFIYRTLHGLSSKRIKLREGQKSISHESTFRGKPGDIERYTEITDKLFERTIRAMKKKGYLARTVTLKIRFNGFDTITRSRSLSFATDKEDILREIVDEILTPHLNDPRGLRLIGIGFSHLEKRRFVQRTLDDFF